MKIDSLAQTAFGVEARPECRDAFEVMAIAILEKLDTRWAYIVAQRHGMLDGEPKPFRAIEIPYSYRHGKLVEGGKTAERIRIQYWNGLRRLRHPNQYPHLRNFFRDEDRWDRG